MEKPVMSARQPSGVRWMTGVPRMLGPKPSVESSRTHRDEVSYLENRTRRIRELGAQPMNPPFDQAEADAVIAALEALDATTVVTAPEKQRHKAALEELGKLRGFEIDATSRPRRAVA